MLLESLWRNDALTSFCFIITVTKSDIEEHFSSHGSGKITEIKLMNGFGFIEYDDQLDARDIVPGKNGLSDSLHRAKSLTLFSYSLPYAPPHDFPPNDPSLIHTTDGSDFKGERLTVQFARGPRRKEAFPGPPDRNALPRPRRTMFRMQISGLPETSWQVSSKSIPSRSS